MSLWLRVIRIWLPIAVATTAVCGTIAVTVQQNYRNGLDDPQIQLAHDAAARLGADAAPESVVNSPSVDAQRSLAPFLIVYGPSGVVLASGATLGGTTPSPPVGVLQTARSLARNGGSSSGLLGGARDYDRVTWQPRPGVRLASVSVATADGRVVLAARNMSEVEGRESQLTWLVAFGWLVAIGGALVAAALVERLVGRRAPRPGS
jgi:hypothetical protein